ncbi:MAG: histidine kinase [Kofleriaceae bacterium]|nr:histidine kinase [Kofleriaceae bacterium]
MATRLERQLETAQQVTPIGRWEWDLATDAVTWSDELYRIYGLRPRSQAITFAFVLERFDPSTRERVHAEIKASLETGQRFAARVRIVRPDGSMREVYAVGEPIQGTDGNAVAMVGTCRDLTDEIQRDEKIRLFADIVDNMAIGLSVWRLETPGVAESLRLVASNLANEQLTGIVAAQAVGKRLPEVFPAALGTELPQLILGTSNERPRRELTACRVTGLHGAPTFAVKAFVLPDRCIGLALEDVTLAVRTQRMHFAERRALAMLAAGAPLGDILEALTEVIEELVPDTMVSVLVIDRSGTRLLHGAAPSLPEAYNRAVHGAPIGPAAGSCGTAAYKRDTVIVSDIANDPLWVDYRDLALAHDLRACWSTPILANDGHVLGTFAVYYKSVRNPTPGAMALVMNAVHVASIAIERRFLDEQLRALSERIEATREEERTGIAREIHDELGQALTALKLDLAWIARRRGDDPAISGKLREMMSSTDDLIATVRRISSELRPGILDDVGLAAAIEWQAEEFHRRTGIHSTVSSALGDVQLERGLATAVFRIFQEAITNVARHASASAIFVDLRLERGRLKLDIADDGIGLPDSPPRIGALGLLGMRERARRLDGECVITRREPRGTLVSLTVPLRFPADRVEIENAAELPRSNA